MLRRICGVVLAWGLCFGAGPAAAASRISFDHGWEFRYYGKEEPGAASGTVKADSEQAGHAAIKAIDGDTATRWCANDGKPGHHLTVSPKTREQVASIRILWENERSKQVVVLLDYGKKKETRKIKTKGKEMVLDIDNRRVESVKITINGTGDGNWASIREVEFRDEAKKPLPVSASYREAMPGFDAKGFRKVQLPHDWAIESKFLAEEPNETGKLPWVGYGWYRREFNIPADFDAETQRYYLDFDGVMSNPQVFVNGKKAGEWAYGYSSFRVDMTPHLRAGKKNVVAVLASNKPLSTRWYPGAGIYRHVWLEKTDPVHIDQWGVYVTTPKVTADVATISVETTVRNTGKKQAVVTVMQRVDSERAEAKKITLAPGASQSVKQTLQLKRPELWCCENPHLYTLETMLHADGKPLERRETRFGVRHIQWKPEGFFLNGKRVQIKGVCEHHDLGPLGAAFHERAYERKIEILKNMGCNAIRMTHNPPAPQVLDLCDKHGMLVIDELFDIWQLKKYDKTNGYHIYWKEWWQKDVRQFMLRDRNHPCIIAWSGGNEVPEITAKGGADVEERLRDEMLRYDSSRPFTVGTNAADGAYNGFGDKQGAFGFNYKPSRYADYVKKRPNMPFYASETASCLGSRDTYVFPLRWDVQGGYKGEGVVPFQVSAYGVSAPGWGYCPDVEFTVQDAVPNVAGEFVWTGFDYLGEPTPYNQDASIEGNIQHLSQAERKAVMREYRKMGNKAPSRSSYFGMIDLAGFPKDTYFLYRSRWNPQARYAHLLPHWNWPGREGQVTPVMCFSSGDEAELFLNGKSLGIRRKGEGAHFTQAGVKVCKNGHRFVWEDVVYAPGELKVEVRKNGEPWAVATRVTTGKAVAVEAEVDRPEIQGDGYDLAYIALSLVDADGYVVPTDCRKVNFTIEGPAELVGFCNGNPIDQTCMQDPKQEFFNGRIVAVVRSKRKASGKATVVIKAANLPEKRVIVNVSLP